VVVEPKNVDTSRDSRQRNKQIVEPAMPVDSNKKHAGKVVTIEVG
jgi:hypothetical protein